MSEDVKQDTQPKQSKKEAIKQSKKEAPKQSNGNKPEQTPEFLNEVASAYYNSAVKIVEAGGAIMPYNSALGMMVVKVAEALSDQVAGITGLGNNNNSCGTGNSGQGGQRQSRPKVELSEEVMEEVLSLEAELEGELGEL